MKYIKTLMCMVLMLMLSASARAEHYEVFLLAGQSNMDGRAAINDLVGDLAQYTKATPNILINFSAGGLHRPLTLSKGLKPSPTRLSWMPTVLRPLTTGRI